jgi:AraC-like DNA-binding protein
MSNAVAVFHGNFGRVCLYSMDKAMVPHGHREGHLIFHVQGPPGEVVVDDRAFPIAPGQAVAISPWQTHYYRPVDRRAPTLALVLYIRPVWFLEASRRANSTLRFGRVGVEVTDQLSRLVFGAAHAMADPDHDDPLFEDRLCTLTQAAFDQSWQWTERGAAFTGPDLPTRDFRIRKAMRALQERLGDMLELDEIARESGLSRPHFYKLFRTQVGVTPNVYLNALRMERAIGQLTETGNPVTDIGLDLGFASQASFSRFFIANGVVPPSVYRRSAQRVILT